MTWSEPTTWHQAAAQLAQSEGRSQFPWLSWTVTFCLFSGFIIWEWLDADPTIRGSIPKLMGIIVVGFGFMLCLGWFYVIIQRSNTTTIREGGLVHGSRFKRQWIPWSRIEYFYIREDRLEPWSFRFLTWKRIDEGEESFSVIPDSIDISRIVRCLVTNKVEQVGGCDVEMDHGCTWCGQGVLYLVKLVPLGPELYILCGECERMWKPEDAYDPARAIDFYHFMESRGHNPFWENVKILKRLSKVVKQEEVEQAGADQPAPQPADKVPAKVQPSTPTSKDAPR